MAIQLPDRQNFSFEDFRPKAVEWLKGLPVPALLVDQTGLVISTSTPWKDIYDEVPLGVAASEIFTTLSSRENLEAVLSTPSPRSIDVRHLGVGVEGSLSIGRPLGPPLTGFRVAVFSEFPANPSSPTNPEASALLDETEPLMRLLCALKVPALVLANESVTYATPSASAHLGLPRTDLIGMPLSLLLSENLSELATEASQNGSGEIFVRETNGNSSLLIPFGAESVLLLGEPSDVPSAPQAFESERHRLVLSGLIHEINNPLAFVLPAARSLKDSILLARDVLPEPQFKICRELTDELLSGLERITGVLNAHRGKKTDAGQPEPVAINEVIEETFRLASPSLPTTISLRRDLGLVPSIVGSPQRLGQIILNLILNGAQAIQESGGSGGMIVVRTWEEHGQVRVEVTDTGPGVPSHLRDEIFKPFFTTKASGSGLGLSICREMAREMGGDLRLASAPRRGATFQLFLNPWEQAPRPEPNREKVADTKRKPETIRRILLVDDDPQVRRALARMLRARWEVMEAGTIDEALTLAETHLFDVLVTDLVMPEGGGGELLRRLGELGHHLAGHAVVVTGMAPDTALALPHQMISKPVLPEVLLHAVEEAGRPASRIPVSPLRVE